MSRTLNKVMLIGNVGQDPELKHTPSGIPVTSFRMATTENWHDRDGKLREHTDWHTVVAWRGLAEVIYKIVRKGCRIYIEGKIQSRSFEDKTGVRKHIVEVVADNMLMLDYKRARFGDFQEDSYDGYSEATDFPEPDFSTESDVSNSKHETRDDLKIFSKIESFK